MVPSKKNHGFSELTLKEKKTLKLKESLRTTNRRIIFDITPVYHVFYIPYPFFCSFPII